MSNTYASTKPPTSGTNTGDVTLGAVGSTPSANGASLAAQVLTLQPVDATHPGVVTTGTQTIAGAKTFSSTVTGPASGVGFTTAGQMIADGGFRTSATNTQLDLRGTSTNGAGAIPVAIGSSANMTTAGAKLVAFQNNMGATALEVVAVDKDGVLTYPTGSAAAVSGTATLSSGVATVSTTAVKANSFILVTLNTAAGTMSAQYCTKAADISAATSFKITGVAADKTTQTLDTSTVNWMILNKVP